MKYILLIVSLVFFSMAIAPESTQKKNNTEATAAWGTMTFTVTTAANGGNYTPKHVLAIWIRDINGNFVQTNKLRGNNRKGYLYTWKGNSNQNVTDAITGSTLSNHTTHTISWDCTDYNGVLVPDGDYKVAIEFTDKHAQGPFAEFTFTKGSSPVHLTPANQGKFSNIDLQYTPSPASISNHSDNSSLKVFPNPVDHHLSLELEKPLIDNAEMFILNSQGQICSEIMKAEKGEHQFVFNSNEIESLPNGIYLVHIKGKDFRSSKRIIVMH